MSEIIVGETTREQIEAMFGVPHHTLRCLNNIRYNNYDSVTLTMENHKKWINNSYVYLISRSNPLRDSIWGVRPPLYTLRLLLVSFKDDVVISIMGPEPGAVELLKELYD